MFKNINTLNSKDKIFFIEKVNLFIKLMYTFALKNNFKLFNQDNEINEQTIIRLKGLEIFKCKPGTLRTS